MSVGTGYGLLAEFDGPAELVAAVRRAREAGYVELEAFSPVPVEGVWERLGPRRPGVPTLTFFGAALGAAFGYWLQYYLNAVVYPLNVGGRPPHSWPPFIVVAFEMGVLLGALGAVVGMLALNGLPRPHHPVFNVPAFDLASQTRFFLCVPATDPRFDPEKTPQFLDRLGSSGVWEVPL